jgi:hypothetical protein
MSALVAALLTSLVPCLSAATVEPGTILVTEGSTIVAIDPGTGQQTVAFSGGLLLSLGGIAVGKSGDIYVVSSAGGDSPRQIVRVKPSTGEQSVVGAFPDWLQLPWQLAVDAEGDILIANGGAVYKMDPDDGVVTGVSTDARIGAVRGIAAEKDGNIIVGQIYGEQYYGAVFRIDRATGLASVLTSGGSVIQPVSIAVGVDASIFASTYFDSVVRIDPATGAQTPLFGCGSYSYTSVATGPNGELYEACSRPWFGGPINVWQIEPNTGEARLVTQDGYLSRPWFMTVYPTIDNEARVWVGLKNSDDQGARFDLAAKILVNGTQVAEGTTLCVGEITRNPAKALDVSIPFGPASSESIGSGDTMTLKLLTRVGTNLDGTKCLGHNNAVGLRLYYDAVTRPSRLAPMSPGAGGTDLFLHAIGSQFFLDDVAPGRAQPQSRDSGPVSFAGGNSWVEIGVWSRVIP